MSDFGCMFVQIGKRIVAAGMLDRALFLGGCYAGDEDDSIRRSYFFLIGS